MGEVACQLHLPQEADLVVQLDGGDGLGQVCHDPLKELVVDGETDEKLELVVFSKTVACSLYPGDQPELGKSYTRKKVLKERNGRAPCVHPSKLGSSWYS